MSMAGKEKRETLLTRFEHQAFPFRERLCFLARSLYFVLQGGLLCGREFVDGRLRL